MTIRNAALLAAACILMSPMGAGAAEQTRVPESTDASGYVASMSDRSFKKRLVIGCSQDGKVLVVVSGRKITKAENVSADVRYSFDGGSEIRETWNNSSINGSETEGSNALSFISMLKAAHSNLLFSDEAGIGVTFTLNGSAGRLLRATVTLCETLWEKGALRA